LGKINQPPADNAVQIRLRPDVNDLSKRCTLRIGKQRRLAWCFPIKQAAGAMLIEVQNPIPDDLKPDPANLCGHAPAAALVNCC
jgi:hypothetical protein